MLKEIKQLLILFLSILLLPQIARILQTTRPYNLLFNQQHSTNTSSLSFGAPFHHTKNELNISTQEEEGKGLLAIFYNVYFPKYSIDALKIVQEQLDARKKSSTLSNVTLYYTQIGEFANVTFPPCDPCIRLNSVEKGGEVLTLQKLYEHCEKKPFGRVIYLHNKGSYHQTIKNGWLRSILTKAVFSDECARMPRYDEDKDGNGGANYQDKNNGSRICDICAANFIVVPSPEAPGNMFVAECSYVNRLIPPIDYQDAREMMMNELWNKTKGELEQIGFATKSKRHEEQFNRPSWVGTGRYAMEQWAFSHPSVRPCDTSIKSFSYMNPRHPAGYDAPKRKMAPRQNSTDLRLSVHPFFRLEGLLYKYTSLYGTMPPNNSWVYNFFE